MGCYPLLAATGRLSDAACAALGLGIAVQAARWAARRAEFVPLFFQRALPALALTALSVAAAVLYYEWKKCHVDEPRHYAQLPAPAAGAPNVLLIVMDTVRADHLSAYGYARRTSPHLERLAREGALFQNAFATSSWSLPSHASLFTGLYPFQHRADPLPLSPEFLTLAEFLNAHGYATASFVANTIWCTHAAGIAQGFVHHEDYFGNAWDMASRTVYSQKALEGALALFGEYRAVERKRAEDINRSLLRWLDQRPNRPFFVFLNYFDAHEPVFPPAPYDAMFAPPSEIRDREPFEFKAALPGSIPAREQQAQIAAYDGAIAYMDAQIGALWAELERRGLAENTLLIVTSDHGESLGEGGLFGHQSSLRREQVHVPLLLRWPGGVPAGRQFAAAVSLQQIPATLVHLARPGSAGRFPGRSLAALWSTPGEASREARPVLMELARVPESDVPPFWPVYHGALRGVVVGRWHYIERSDGAVELYDLLTDRAEQRNLAASPQGRTRTQDLRRELGRYLRAESNAGKLRAAFSFSLAP
jgi:arylsulfatase A-like enzyme